MFIIFGFSNFNITYKPANLWLTYGLFKTGVTLFLLLSVPLRQRHHATLVAVFISSMVDRRNARTETGVR